MCPAKLRGTNCSYRRYCRTLIPSSRACSSSCLRNKEYHLLACGILPHVSMSAGVPVDYDVWKDWNESNQLFWANALGCFSRAWSRLTKREEGQREQPAAATAVGIPTGTTPSTPLGTKKGAAVDGRMEGDE